MFKKLYSAWILGGLLLILVGILIYFLNNQPEVIKDESHKKADKKILEVNDYGGEHLQTVGQKVHQKNFSTLKLVKNIPVNKNYKMSSMIITIKDIRIIELSDMDDDTKESLSAYTGLTFEEAAKRHYKENLSMEEIGEIAEFSKIEIDKKITYFEITYSVQNTSSKEVQFFSLQDCTFNDDLTYSVPDNNFIFSDDTFMGTKSVSRIDYKPNEKREGIIGLINDSGDVIKQITSFSFTTDDLLDGDTHELIEKAKTFKLDFSK
ncbi:hypothetical protein [Bacillus massiliigorillae]|uniref:hypothetical protein n=1 Tax=Bacillus massiliigorillae TaxID=1243664 RepID=UPI0003A62EE8|nr:hypothetical protein [Bacillus massiliigorillae]